MPWYNRPGEEPFQKARDISITGDYYGAIVLLKQAVEFEPEHVQARLAEVSGHRLAWRQVRVMSSVTPCRPSVRRTAHTSTCRARCEDWGA